MEKKYCTAVALAAGKGSRMGGKTAEQCMEIGDKPLVAYALEVSGVPPAIDEIMLMTNAGHMEYVRTEIVKAHRLKRVNTIEVGGGKRYESAWKTPCTLMEREEEERESMVRNRQDGYVFIRNGARPFTTGEIIEWACRVVCNYNAHVVGMPVEDTIRLVSQEGIIESSPNRNMVWRAQTPQVLFVPLIMEAFARQTKADCTGITDDAIVVEAQIGVKVRIIMDSYANIKIMTPEDLFMAEVLKNSVVQL